MFALRFISSYDLRVRLAVLSVNGFVLPKSARFFDRRIAAGFSWTPYFGYGGEAVFPEMLQLPDGKPDFQIPRDLC